MVPYNNKKCPGKGLIMNKIWLLCKHKMNIKETLLFLVEGIAFLLCLAVILATVVLGCVMIDSCYYYYVPGGEFDGR